MSDVIERAWRLGARFDGWGDQFSDAAWTRAFAECGVDPEWYARRARPVLGHATVYFPSVPEETPTNVTVNVVHGSFPDVTWDSWAVLPVEKANLLFSTHERPADRLDLEVFSLSSFEACVIELV